MSELVGCRCQLVDPEDSLRLRSRGLATRHVTVQAFRPAGGGQYKVQLVTGTSIWVGGNLLDRYSVEDTDSELEQPDGHYHIHIPVLESLIRVANERRALLPHRRAPVAD